MKECVFDEGKVTCNRLVKIFEKNKDEVHKFT